MSKPEHLPYEITLEVRDTCLCLHLRRAGGYGSKLIGYIT